MTAIVTREGRAPGSVRLATDESIPPSTTGGEVQVLDSNPPGA